MLRHARCAVVVAAMALAASCGTETPAADPTVAGEAITGFGLDLFGGTGRLLGIADDPRLVIDRIIHEAFVAMDEDGTEAAAATVVLYDEASGVTLFIGQITDPSA